MIVIILNILTIINYIHWCLLKKKIKIEDGKLEVNAESIYFMLGIYLLLMYIPTLLLMCIFLNVKILGYYLWFPNVVLVLHNGYVENSTYLRSLGSKLEKYVEESIKDEKRKQFWVTVMEGERERYRKTIERS